jgi:hypothetical protein
MKIPRKTIGILVVLILILALAVPSSNFLLAQEPTEEAPADATPTPTPLPTPTAYPMQALGFTLIGHADIQIESDGQVLASAASLALPPGAAALPFTVTGPTVIMVQSGEIVVTSDNASISFVDTSAVMGIFPSGGTPGPVETLLVVKGQQVVLPPGATCLIRNDSAAAASVLVLSIDSVPDR